MKRQIKQYDLLYKGFPFECENCGNKPTPIDVVVHKGCCAICDDTITTYTVDAAELILKLNS